MTDTMPVTLKRLARQGYLARPPEMNAVRWALLPNQGHKAARSILLMGDPGVGKSALAEAVAKVLDTKLLVYQCHDWTDADDLFMGVNIKAAISGDHEDVHQPGILALVAQASHKGRTVLLLDELDKAPERAEALLLDWLQTGRVPLKPGHHLSAVLSNLIVFITSNAARDHTEALTRRCRRVYMKPLAFRLQCRILADKSGVVLDTVTAIWSIAAKIAKADGANLSIQEGIHLLEELSFAESAQDVEIAMVGWAVRDVGGFTYVKRNSRAIGSLWSVIQNTAM